MRKPLKSSCSSCLGESKMFASVIILVICSVMGVSAATEFSYADLQAMSPESCSPRDTCATEKRNRLDYEMDWTKRNCFCDNLCSEYGDCCVDAQFRKPEEEKNSVDNHQCVKMRQWGDLYMKGSCKADWQDQGIAEECYNAAPGPLSPKRDPVRDMPVTSRNSRITYKNYFCAVCNNDSTTLEFWKPRIECDKDIKKYNDKFGNLTLKYVYNNLVNENGKWGMHLDTELIGKPDFHICEIDPQMPPTVPDMIRHCKCTLNEENTECIRPISTCKKGWNDVGVEKLCHSYTSIMHHGCSNVYKVYKNIHCAICNDINTDEVHCKEPRCIHARVSSLNFEFGNINTFSMLFDFTDFSGSNVVNSKCGIDEIWDPFFKQCRNVVCGKENYEYKLGICVPVGDVNASVSTDESPKDISTPPSSTGNTINTSNTINIRTNDNVPILFPGEIGTATEIGEGTDDSEITTDSSVSEAPGNGNSQTLNCNRILLPKGDYKIDADGIVMVEKYGKIYKPSEYENHKDGILVCTITKENSKFTPLMGYVTLAGLSLSCLGIILHLIAFFFVPDLRNLSGKNLASLCVALLAAYATFILGVFGEAGKSECFIIAAAMYYFFLSSFCWMNIMSFDIWRTLRMATSELRVSQGGQWRKFILYSIYGWLVPLAALIIVVVLDTTKPAGFRDDFLPSLGQRWCWFGQRKALLVFFAAPLAALMGINFIFFVFSARIIADTHQSTAKMSSCSPHQDQFKLYMRLALLMGLTWISGIVAGYLQMEAIWYAFVLMNTLQGVFIFLAFTCTRKVWRSITSGPCCRKHLPRHAPTWHTRSSSSSRQGLDSRDSNESHLSGNSSMAHLTANNSRSSNDSY